MGTMKLTTQNGVGTMTTLALITSTHPLPNGSHEAEIHPNLIWESAQRMGLNFADYGRYWFVYASRQDYEDSLD